MNVSSPIRARDADAMSSSYGVRRSRLTSPGTKANAIKKAVARSSSSLIDFGRNSKILAKFVESSRYFATHAAALRMIQNKAVKCGFATSSDRRCGIAFQTARKPLMMSVVLRPRTGRLHHNSPPAEDLFEVLIVPSGGEAFVLDSNLQRVIVLEQAEGRAAEAAEVRVGMPFS